MMLGLKFVTPTALNSVCAVFPVVEEITVFLGTFRSSQQEIQQETNMKVLKIKIKKHTRKAKKSVVGFLSMLAYKYLQN